MLFEKDRIKSRIKELKNEIFYLEERLKDIGNTMKSSPDLSIQAIKKLKEKHSEESIKLKRSKKNLKYWENKKIKEHQSEQYSY